MKKKYNVMCGQEFVGECECYETADDWCQAHNEIPEAAAQVLRKAVDRMISKGDLSAKSKWQILEFLSADYLGGGSSGP